MSDRDAENFNTLESSKLQWGSNYLIDGSTVYLVECWAGNDGIWFRKKFTPKDGKAWESAYLDATHKWNANQTLFRASA